MKGPTDRWKKQRDAIREQVMKDGWSDKRGSFVQYYGSEDLDASLLMMPLVGFVPATSDRMRRTIEAIERELVRDGFVMRYCNHEEVDGLPRGEGAFLACTFWLADCLDLIGRHDDALRTFERVLAVCNDVGLLAEEYDPVAKRQLGNFPQAFSHVSLVNTAHNLSGDMTGPAEHRLGT
jgi:GH15 family glucan-1,4-alpha-glucosidase